MSYKSLLTLFLLFIFMFGCGGTGGGSDPALEDEVPEEKESGHEELIVDEEAPIVVDVIN